MAILSLPDQGIDAQPQGNCACNSGDDLRLAKLCLDESGDAIYRSDPNGKILYVNEACCDSLGYTREELLSLSIKEFDLCDWSNVWDGMKKASRLKFESRHRRKQGELYPVEITGRIVRHGGREYGFFSARDVSRCKGMESELIQERHFFRMLMDNVPDCVYFKDSLSRFVRISRAHAEMFGLADPADACGKTDFDFFSREYAGQAFRDEQRILRTGEPMIGIAERATWPDGRTTWLATAKFPLRTPDGQVTGTFGISRNITKSKTAETALRASEQFNKRIIESSFDGIAVLDAAGQPFYVSKAGRELLDLSEGERIGNWAAFWEGDHRKRAQRALDAALTGKIGRYQADFKTRTGHRRFFDLVVSPITGDEGAVERLVCVFRDVTEQRQVESQAARAQKLESIGQLAAGIAHEINTPIQYIGDNGKFLEEAFKDLTKVIRLCDEAGHSGGLSAKEAVPDVDLDYLESEIPKAISQLLEGVEHVARIVRAMKEFSHPGSIDKVPVDVNRAIANTALVCKNEWKHVADLRMDFDRALPRVHCLAGEINQVMLNLIVNATHAISDVVKNSSDKGLIGISTRRDGNWAEIRVSDTGTGIPEEIQAKIFDPFFTTKPMGKGTGQGLALAHTVIVQKHSGSITFESTPGVGTVFVVRLPLAPETE
ncbi:MAG: PAS domain S-box protein [Bryobacteraceae bacterium]